MCSNNHDFCSEKKFKADYYVSFIVFEKNWKEKEGNSSCCCLLYRILGCLLNYYVAEKKIFSILPEKRF